MNAQSGKALVPKLRFRGFSGEWKTKKLDNLITQSKSKNKNLEFDKTQVLSVAAEAGVVNQIEYHGRSYAGVSVAPYGIVRKGELVYTKSPLKAYPYGIIKLNETSDGIVSTLYAIYKLNDNASGKFLDYYFYHPPRVNKYLKPLVSIGAKNDMKVNNDSVIASTVIIPTFLEQKKIAGFLGAVDDRISALQKKVELMKKYKKGIMQKIFSQQIRFKDENSKNYPAWQEKKLGEVFEECTGKGGLDKTMLSVTINRGIIPFSDTDRKDSSSANKSNYKHVEIDDIAYNSMRMWQGASGVSKYKGIVSPAYTVIRPLKGNISGFWGYYFKLPQVIFTFQRHSQGLTSDTWNLKFGQLSKIKLPSPTETEQEKIADFLTSVDDKIDLTEWELEQAKQFKKALLQQMFV